METTSVCSEAFWSVRSSRCPSNALWSRWSNSDSGIPPSSLLGQWFYCSWFKNGRSCSYVLCVLNSCWDVWVFFLCSNLIRFFFRFTFGVWSWDNNFFMIRLLPKYLSRGKMCKLKKKLACYKGRVVGNLFKDSLVMMHKHSSFPHWGRPEVRDQRYVLLWSCVENFNCTSWKNK